ncbi:MAG: hypothetical protein KDC54_08120 [Lewinella sp.]|nr:hypothetical protein [Lewinella sp.]
MKKVISEKVALYGVLVILSLITVFHVLILIGVIPFDIVWGGRLTSREEMLRMESVSLLLNLLMLGIVARRAGWLKWGPGPRIIRILFWVMAGLFALNTLGNLASTSDLERAIFTPLTLLLVVFCWRLALPAEDTAG